MLLTILMVFCILMYYFLYININFIINLKRIFAWILLFLLIIIELRCFGYTKMLYEINGSLLLLITYVILTITYIVYILRLINLVNRD